MKKAWAVFVAVILGLLFAPVVTAKTVVDMADEELTFYSPAVYVYNLSAEEEMYALSADMERPVASLTKIMTAILALENHELDEKIKITEEMTQGLDGYVVAGYTAGEEVSVQDLMYALILPSAGDAAQALAISTAEKNGGGGIEKFVEMMNARAAEMGLSRTHFSNPVGMDESDFKVLQPEAGWDTANHSTAREMAEILKEALSAPHFSDFFQADEYVASDGKKFVKTTAEQAEKYGINTAKIMGSKTGYTGEAGRCLASITRQDGTDILMVNLGAAINSAQHIADAEGAYEYFAENYTVKQVLTEEEELFRLPVKDAHEKEYVLRAPEELTVYMLQEKDVSELTVVYNGERMIGREIAAGAQIGTLKVLDGEKEIAALPVYLNEEMHYRSYILYIGMTSLAVIAEVAVWGLAVRRMKIRRTREARRA